MGKNKFYVVWNGRKKGIFTSWEICKEQVEGLKNAQYKSFETLADAEAAWKLPYKTFIQHQKKPVGNYIRESLVVDAACNHQGIMEYQGIWLATGEQAFHQSGFTKASNNLGEFFALVHAIALLQQKKYFCYPIYSDSVTAMAWVRKKKIQSVVTEPDPKTADYLHRCLQFLEKTAYQNPILKWETAQWGENPADFGRK